MKQHRPDLPAQCLLFRADVKIDRSVIATLNQGEVELAWRAVIALAADTIYCYVSSSKGIHFLFRVRRFRVMAPFPQRLALAKREAFDAIFGDAGHNFA